MEQFKVYTKVLSEIKKSAQIIIRKSIPLMETIIAEDGEYISSLMEDIPGLTHTQAAEILQETSLEWAKDAIRVIEEIDRFIAMPDNDTFKINLEGCPFLAEVWNGDAYDKTGVDGLRELLSDLKGQLANVNEEFLLKTAKTQLLGEE